MTSSAQVNSAVFNLLFLEIVYKALEDSKTTSGQAEQPDHEAAFYRIEQLGYSVGQRLIERLLLQTQAPRMSETIEAAKYLCKEFWPAVFGKPIDNLKTNHRGIFVLQDHAFGWIARFAVDTNAPETARMAVLYLAFPCGLLRGALANMGILATVTAEIPLFPQCVFQIRTQQSQT